MLTAILSMLASSRDDETLPRAVQRVAGRTVVRHQLTAVIAAGAERVVMLADGDVPDRAELMSEAAANGVDLAFVSDAASLASAISRDDRVLVLADGLLPQPEALRRVVPQRPAIATFPAEKGLPAGFERIDLAVAFGGVMLVPGSVAERLGDLPEGWDAASALLRVAAQSGVPMVPLDETLAGSPAWRMIAARADAQLAETGWLDARLSGASSASPGRAIALAIARRWGMPLLEARTRPVRIAGGGLILALLGTCAAILNFPVPGLLAIGLGWLAVRLAALLEQIASATQRHVREAQADWAIDVLLAIALGFAIAPRDAYRATPVAEAMFIAAVLILGLRLAARLLPARAAAWIGDRLLGNGLLAALAVAGVLLPGVMLLALAGLAAALYAAGPNNRLTRP